MVFHTSPSLRCYKLFASSLTAKTLVPLPWRTKHFRISKVVASKTIDYEIELFHFSSSCLSNFFTLICNSSIFLIIDPTSGKCYFAAKYHSSMWMWQTCVFYPQLGTVIIRISFLPNFSLISICDYFYFVQD